MSLWRLLDCLESSISPEDRKNVFGKLNGRPSPGAADTIPTSIYTRTLSLDESFLDVSTRP